MLIQNNGNTLATCNVAASSEPENKSTDPLGFFSEARSNKLKLYQLGEGLFWSQFYLSHETR